MSKKFPLDLSKFKKIHSDEHSATLQHPEGHTIHIAVGKLDPTTRKHLESIPMIKGSPSIEGAPHFDKGGPVDTTTSGDALVNGKAWENIKKAFTPDSNTDTVYKKPKQTQQTLSDVPEYNGGEIKAHYAEGTQDGGAKPPAEANKAKAAAMNVNAESEKKVNYGQNIKEGLNLSEQKQSPVPQIAPKQSLSDVPESHEQAKPSTETREVAYPDTDVPKPYPNYAHGGELRQSNPKLEQSKLQPPKPHYAEGSGDVESLPMNDQARFTQDTVDAPQSTVPQQPQPNPSALPPVPSDTARFTQETVDQAPTKSELGADQQQAANVDVGKQLLQQGAQTKQAGEQQVAQAKAAPPPSSTNEDASQSMSLMGGVQKQMQGFKQQAAAQAALGNEQAKSYDQANAQQQQLLDQTNKQFQANLDERKNFISDINANHIDPNKYWDDHSKLLSGLGIILAGFDPKGRPNQAMDFINHQIDRSIQAQAQNLNSKQNLLRANIEQFGNIRDAATMTRVMMHDMVKNTLDKNVALNQSPQAKANALVLQGQLEQQSAPMMMQMAMRKALVNMNNQPRGEQQQPGQPQQAQGFDDNKFNQQLGLLRALNPEAAKEFEGRYVPHVGLASVPVPEKAREELSSRQSLQDQVHNLRMWSQQHSGSLSPTDVNYGKALAASVQDAYRRANGQGVFREAEADFVKGIVADDPTAFMNKYRTDPKYKALEDSNAMQLNGAKKALGLPTQSAADRLTPQQQTFANWAKANPNDPRSAQILKKLGM